VPELLLVDDEPTIRLVIGDALSSQGHAVTLAAEGAQALALCQQRAFDLVLTDIRLPKLDGFSLFEMPLEMSPDGLVRVSIEASHAPMEARRLDTVSDCATEVFVGIVPSNFTGAKALVIATT